MSYDKVIDSTLLDAGLTATANAIRAKTGNSSPIAWDSANGFKAAVEGIDTESGVELPELGDTAAQSSDIVYGKILYDDDGNPVTGTMTSFDSEYSPKPKSDGSGNVMIGLTSTENTYLPAWNQLSFKIPFSEFGNATEDDVLADIEFTSSAGLLARGSIPKKTTSDITVNNATVTIPRGYYESVVSKSVSTATQATPSISVDTAGKITASVTQTAGYVSSGTKTATKQLSVQVAQTITPGTSDKTIASGKYLTGTQTIKGDANLVAANIKKGVSIFGVAGSHECKEGITLPTLTNRGSASDLASGKTLYDDNGNPVTGNIVDVDDYHNDAAWNNISLSNPYTSYDEEDESYLLYTDCTLKNDTIFRKNVVIPICGANGYQLGEARPEDVRAGVTFTSGKAGLKKMGIMEVGSGSGDSMGSDIAGVSKFTLAEDATVAGAFVKLGNVPWIAEHINDANLYVNLFSLNTSLKTDSSVFNVVSSNMNCINGSYSGAMYRSSYLSFVSFGSQPFNNTTNTGSVRLCGDSNGDIYIAAYNDYFFAAGEYVLLYGLI